mmetsp:Transcript_5416/g.9107  ORF Transcript_5416/g.9107 Transcript_5416/m.9107 type:complete len:235 (+) Transcript_5416:455-1159(+)
MDIDAELDAFNFIPFKASNVKVSNLTVDFVVESTSTDQVHWSLVETSKITLDSVSIEMKDSFLNWLVNKTSHVINKVIQDQLPKAEVVIDSKVKEINKMISGEGPYTFSVPLLQNHYPLNLTMTKAPEIAKDSNLININFDGLFDYPQNSTVMTPNVKRSAVYPDRLQHSHSEQFWIHESTINSLLIVAKDAIFPLKVNSANMTEQFKALFPSLVNYFGDDLNVTLSVDTYNHT